MVAVCCLTWVGVLWWWQRTGHSPEATELLLYLGVLPLVLAASVLGLRWAWQRTGVAPVAAGAGAVAAAADAPMAAEAAARHDVWQVVHLQANSVAGDQVADVLEAAEAGKPLPQPDGELTNDEGLPVLCARMADKSLALDAVRASLEALWPSVQTNAVDAAVLAPGECVVRALAALQPVLAAQCEGLFAFHQARLNALPDGGASIERLPPAQRPPLPGLRVLLGWPVHWSASEQALARAWVERGLHAEETDLSRGYTIAVSSLAGSGEDLWLRADQLAHGPGHSPWMLVLACDSDVDPVRVQALAAAQRLYDATARPGGCVPGEAAAALLLAPADWTPPDSMALQTVLIHRPALMRRDKPVEAPGRVSHQALAQALEQALMAAQIDAVEVAMLVCDADQHSQRSTELYGLAVQALEHLDPVAEMRLLGRITGHTGAASALLVLAAAAEAVKALKKPTLALTLADPHLRMALVLKPPAGREEAIA